MTRRVLIADDHSTVRVGIRAILSTRGDLEITEAANGEEAIHKARVFHPDLILLDISMPVLNGFEATQVIHKEMPEAHILILTMHNSHYLAAQAKKMGAEGYVVKTDDSAVLLSAVDALLRGEQFISKRDFAAGQTDMERRDS